MNFVKLFVIAGVMGIAVHRIYLFVESIIGNSNFQVLIAMIVAIAIGLAIYGAGLFIFRIGSVERWATTFKGKIKRK